VSKVRSKVVLGSDVIPLNNKCPSCKYDCFNMMNDLFTCKPLLKQQIGAVTWKPVTFLSADQEMGC